MTDNPEPGNRPRRPRGARPPAPPGFAPASIAAADLARFNAGTATDAWRFLGAHLAHDERDPGVRFAVWAPEARDVHVIGDFNGWEIGRHPMQRREATGVWELFVPGLGPGTRYKYEVFSRFTTQSWAKADPYAFASEPPPGTASVVYIPEQYHWNDADWMRRRAERNRLSAPICIYEVHLGSWRRVPEDGDRWLTYQEMADQLVPYACDMGYTHLELLPITEHPFDISWGYQVTGFYSPTARFGDPDGFKYFVDACHRNGLGVILDWVPAHFAKEGHGLGFFDGTHLYEHANPLQGEHQAWGTFIFNYGRPEVLSFLLSNALFWLGEYHLDGFRVDAVASMLYLDFALEPGQWIPNPWGGHENVDAIQFLQKMNVLVHGRHPDILAIAEESTTWAMVTRPTYVGGLGFDLKWDMGWMHDTLDYVKEDPIHRPYHHNKLTFSMMYAFNENYLLPLSHDEVVHLKKPLLEKMPGDDWRKFANLRLLYGYMATHTGKKLLFMGGEFGQRTEWSEARSLDWHLLQLPAHQGLQRCVRDLNRLYCAEPALHAFDCRPEGFEWIDCQDALQSVIAYLRWAPDRNDVVVVACNFTPIPRECYRIGVPFAGHYCELMNTDRSEYGGSGLGRPHGVDTEPVAWHLHDQSVCLTLPPLAAVILKPAG